MIKEDYIKELQTAGEIFQKLREDQTSKRRKRGNLAYLLMHEQHEVERVIQYIRRFGIDEPDDMGWEEQDE